MTEVFGERYEEQKRETMKILEMPLDKRATLDMLWGFYYATGSESAIRRIVTCFRFVDAPDDPDGVDVPQGFVPLYKQLPSFAFGSLVDNAVRHPRVLAILEGLHDNDKTLIPREKQGSTTCSPRFGRTTILPSTGAGNGPESGTGNRRDQRTTRAPPPPTTFSTSASEAMVVSPGVVMARAPWAAPYSIAFAGSLKARKP